MTVAVERVGEWATAGWINEILELSSNGAFMIRLRKLIKDQGLNESDYIKQGMNSEMTGSGHLTFVHVKKSMLLLCSSKVKNRATRNAAVLYLWLTVDGIEFRTLLAKMAITCMDLEEGSTTAHKIAFEKARQLLNW